MIFNLEVVLPLQIEITWVKCLLWNHFALSARVVATCSTKITCTLQIG